MFKSLFNKNGGEKPKPTPLYLHLADSDNKHILADQAATLNYFSSGESVPGSSNGINRIYSYENFAMDTTDKGLIFYVIPGPIQDADTEALLKFKSSLATREKELGKLGFVGFTRERFRLVVINLIQEHMDEGKELCFFDKIEGNPFNSEELSGLLVTKITAPENFVPHKQMQNYILGSILSKASHLVTSSERRRNSSTAEAVVDGQLYSEETTEPATKLTTPAVNEDPAGDDTVGDTVITEDVKRANRTSMNLRNLDISALPPIDKADQKAPPTVESLTTVIPDEEKIQATKDREKIFNQTTVAAKSELAGNKKNFENLMKNFQSGDNSASSSTATSTQPSATSNTTDIDTTKMAPPPPPPPPPPPRANNNGGDQLAAPKGSSATFQEQKPEERWTNTQANSLV